jgi:peptide/nickel transport system permease protein
MALMALFAYGIAPDNTTHANRQIVQLPKQPPGTCAIILLQPIWPQPAEVGFWQEMWSGIPDANIPKAVVSAAPIEGDSSKLSIAGLRGEEDTLDVFEWMLPIDKSDAWTQNQIAMNGAPYAKDADHVEFIDLDGNRTKVEFSKVLDEFYEKNMVEAVFRLGTDAAGRDVLSRLLLGSRVTLGVGFMSVVVSLAIGLLLGSMAGFFRGRVDTVVMWFTSVVWSVPTLMLAIALAFGLGKGTWQLFLAIGAGTWVEVARIVRGQIFSLREMQFVEAAKAMGFSHVRTIVLHVLPNITGPLIIVAAANFASAVLLESGLSFLGMGVQPPTPSWGGMIREGYTQVMFESGAWLAIFPGLAIVLVVVSLNLVGFGLRDAFDPLRKDA